MYTVKWSELKYSMRTLLSIILLTNSFVFIPNNRATNVFYNQSFLKDKNDFTLQIILFLVVLLIVGLILILIFKQSGNDLKHTKKRHDKIKTENKTLRKQIKALQNDNQLKDRLFSIISHDLKDSISPVKGLIDLLKDGTLTRQEFDDLIPELSENTDNACLLLFNLLNWSKSQMKVLKAKPSAFNVQEVIDDKIKLYKPRAKNKNITLKNQTKPNVVYADRDMFEIVFQNLLANALKFSDSGASITISTQEKADTCIITVADTGIGIPKKNLNKLFKSTNLSTRGTNNEKGTGLGLSICKELVALNSGKIWVESIQNIGSTFYVELPKP